MPRKLQMVEYEGATLTLKEAETITGIHVNTLNARIKRGQDPFKLRGTEGVIAANKRRTKHGMHDSRVYKVWAGMKDRCSNPNFEYYHRYGGRGIKVCAEWLVFENFFQSMGHPPAGHTIERDDTDGDYEPGNCRWATRQEQANNRITNTMVTHLGQTKSIAGWSRHTGIATHVIQYRIKAGWKPEHILSHQTFQGQRVDFQ